jgi:hypothetical protein
MAAQRINTRAFPAVWAALLLLGLSACGTPAGDRVGEMYRGLKDRLKRQRPDNEYVYRRNLEDNMKEERERRLFIYRYYPEDYPVIYNRPSDASGTAPRAVLPGEPPPIGAPPVLPKDPSLSPIP